MFTKRSGILSNSQNTLETTVFIDHLPDFEKVVSRLAELLIAVRVGLQDIPESAVKNAMDRLDEVVVGLKKLVYRDNSTAES